MPSAGKKQIVPIGTTGFFFLSTSCKCHITVTNPLIHITKCLTPCLALSSLYCVATSLKRMPDFSFSIASMHLPCFSHRICRTCQKTDPKEHNQQNVIHLNDGLVVTMCLHTMHLNEILLTKLGRSTFT